jgi:UDP-GlcNAc:undecaprenyl-phosphate/decaprenyl-phosphate GlcNAc-1-phosphate transferase
MASELILASLASFMFTLSLTPFVIIGARRFRLIDVPNARSSHAASTPRAGGLGVLVSAAVVGIAAAGASSDVMSVVVGSSVLGGIGLLDDRFRLPAWPRLVAQIVVPALCAAAVSKHDGVALVLAVLIAIASCASYVNAFNFMDGINGISATQAAAAAAFLAAVAHRQDVEPLVFTSLAMLGAVIGFIPYNAPSARVFLGDVGSYGIGFWLAATALLLWDSGAPPLVLLGPFALYLGDTGNVLVQRSRRGAPLLEAHREHAYQLLVQSGLSHAEVSGTCLVLTAVTSALMFSVSDSQILWQIAALAVVATIVGAYLRIASRRHDRALVAAR